MHKRSNLRRVGSVKESGSSRSTLPKRSNTFNTRDSSASSKTDYTNVSKIRIVIKTIFKEFPGFKNNTEFLTNFIKN